MARISDVRALASRYRKEVYWSAEDNAFIGSLPEICGPCCHSDTELGAFRLLISVAKGYAGDKLEGLDCGCVPDPKAWPETVKRRS